MAEDNGGLVAPDSAEGTETEEDIATLHGTTTGKRSRSTTKQLVARNGEIGKCRFYI